jgi:hypothetical protein
VKGVEDLSVSWQGKFDCCQCLEIWRVIPRCLVLGIWREHNARLFEGKEDSVSDLKLSFLKTMLRVDECLGPASYIARHSSPSLLTHPFLLTSREQLSSRYTDKEKLSSRYEHNTSYARNHDPKLFPFYD